MSRWIAFDQDTASKLRSLLPNGAVFEAPGRTALEYALTATRPVVALLGPAAGDETIIAVFRATTLREPVAQLPEAVVPPPPSAPVRESSPVRASGFLGLSDDFSGADEEENEENKRWWQFWR